MNAFAARNASRIAVLCAIISIVGMISLSLFFAIEVSQPGGFHIWGPLSDISLLLQMLLLAVVALALYPLLKPVAPRLMQASTIIGIAGMLAAVLLQFLLIVRVMPFEQEVGPLLVATAGAGGLMKAR